MFGRPDITTLFGRQLTGRQSYFYMSTRCQSVKLFSIKRRGTPQVIRELSSLIEKKWKNDDGTTYIGQPRGQGVTQKPRDNVIEHFTTVSYEYL